MNPRRWRDRLQTKLNNISPESDRASLIWARGFLTGMLQDLAARVPESAVQQKPTSIEKSSKLLEDTQRIPDGLEQRSLKRASRDQSRPYYRDRRILAIARHGHSAKKYSYLSLF